MAAEMQNKVSRSLAKMKLTDDCIIDEGVHTTITDQEIVNQWNSKICKKIKVKLSVCNNVLLFEDFLKEYLRLLKEQALNFKDKKLLKENILNHLYVFNLYYKSCDRAALNTFNYFDYAESILLFVINLELEVIRHIKKNHVAKKTYGIMIKKIAQKIIKYLAIYLHFQEVLMLHVLLRLEHKYKSQSYRKLLYWVYKYFLVTRPVKDFSDEGFCRHYLLYQKLKNVGEDNEQSAIDKIMCFRFTTTLDDIQNNRALQTILSPANAISDLVDVLTDGQQAAVNMYFKHVKQKPSDNETQLINLDSDDEDTFIIESAEKRRNGYVKLETESRVLPEKVFGSKRDAVVVIYDDDDFDDVEIIESVEENASKELESHQKTPSGSETFLEGIPRPTDKTSTQNITQAVDPSPISTEQVNAEKIDLHQPSKVPPTKLLLTEYIKCMQDDIILSLNQPSSEQQEMEQEESEQHHELLNSTEKNDIFGFDKFSSGIETNEEQLEDNLEHVDTSKSLESNNLLETENETRQNTPEDRISVESSSNKLINSDTITSSVLTKSHNAIQTNNSKLSSLTENLENENFSFISSLYTPPSSNRTVEESSPEPHAPDSLYSFLPNINTTPTSEVFSDTPSQEELSHVDMEVDNVEKVAGDVPFIVDEDFSENVQSKSSHSLDSKKADCLLDSMSTSSDDDHPREEIFEQSDPNEHITTNDPSENLDVESTTINNETLNYLNDETDDLVNELEAFINPVDTVIDNAQLDTKRNSNTEVDISDSNVLCVENPCNEKSNFNFPKEQIMSGGCASLKNTDSNNVLCVENPCNEKSNFNFPKEQIMSGGCASLKNTDSNNVLCVENPCNEKTKFNFPKEQIMSGGCASLKNTDSNNVLCVENPCNEKSNFNFPKEQIMSGSCAPLKNKKNVSITNDDFDSKPKKRYPSRASKRNLNGLSTTTNHTTRSAGRVIFESVSAPLSAFDQFQQDQLALSAKPKKSALKKTKRRDSTSSNDSLNLYKSRRVLASVSSIMSPPYENILAEEYKKHMLHMNVCDDKSSNDALLCISEISDIISEPKLNSSSPSNSILVNRSNKRSLSEPEDNERRTKKRRVNFNDVPQIKYISKQRSSDKIRRFKISNAHASLVKQNDRKIQDMVAEVVCEMEKYDRILKRMIAEQTALRYEKNFIKQNEKRDGTCIVTRVDYSKPLKDVSSRSLGIRLGENSLIERKLPEFPTTSCTSSYTSSPQGLGRKGVVQTPKNEKTTVKKRKNAKNTPKPSADIALSAHGEDKAAEHNQPKGRTKKTALRKQRTLSRSE